MEQPGRLVRPIGLTPAGLQRISRRGFGAALLGGVAGAVGSSLVSTPLVAARGGASRSEGARNVPESSDFTIAIIPDPQYLAESCPDGTGSYYNTMMRWIVGNKRARLTDAHGSFEANIKAVVGVGDCVNMTTTKESTNAETAWSILDAHGMPFITPPGNHDYTGGPSARENLGRQFTDGYFSATNRASVYGSGINLSGGGKAVWVGSFDSTGANTAVRLSVSDIDLLILSMDFFAGNDAWTWARELAAAHPASECYITTHAWLTANGHQFGRGGGYGPDNYSMAAAPYSNSAVEAWSNLGINGWPNLFGIFSGHDVVGAAYANADPAWFWQRRQVKSVSTRRQTVQQIFANSQQLDNSCSTSSTTATGAGQIASVFLLTRRPEHDLLEGRMISTQTGNWFNSVNAFSSGNGWQASESLLFSVPFKGLARAKEAPIG